MTQKDNILQELKELNSSLSAVSNQEVYTVPAGYFEGLAPRVLNRIRALEATDTASELVYLSPFVSGISRNTPYQVPQGYFDNLAENSLKLIHQDKEVSAADELGALSPLLSGLKKETAASGPYSVPEGYFDSLNQPGRVIEMKPAARVVSITRRTWFRAAVAAVITGVIVMAGYLLLGSENEPGGRALSKFSRDVKKMDDTQKENLIDFIDAGLSGTETAQVSPGNKSEVKDLLEGISEEELSNFQQQTEDIQDVLMTE